MDVEINMDINMVVHMSVCVCEYIHVQPLIPTEMAWGVE